MMREYAYEMMKTVIAVPKARPTASEVKFRVYLPVSGSIVS